MFFESKNEHVFWKGSKTIRFVGTIENYTLCQNRIVLEPFRYFRPYRREERRIRPSNQRGRLVRCIRRSCSIMTAGERLCRARNVDVFSLSIFSTTSIHHLIPVQPNKIF
jgi:hypothetical protein